MRRSLAIFLAWSLAHPLLGAIAYPELPRTQAVYSPCAVTRTVAVHNAAQLQTAFSTAQFGDQIMLDAGSSYVGNLILYTPSGGVGACVSVTSTGAGSLPALGTRVEPSDASHMAKIISPDYGSGIGDFTQAALGNNYNNTSPSPTDMDVRGYQFRGIEFATGLTNQNFHVIYLSPVEINSPNYVSANPPSNIFFVQCLIHGNPITTTFPNGGAYINGSMLFDVSNSGIIDSYVYDLWGVGPETQAFTFGSAPGPRLLHNNYMAGGSEVAMSGGGLLDYSDGRILTDVTVTHNIFTRDPSWQGGTPCSATKNNFEFKVALRARVTDNIFENGWAQCAANPQKGFAILLTNRAWQDAGDGTVPAIFQTNQVSDILIAHNITRKVGGFINVLGFDDQCVTYSQVNCLQSARWLISDNMSNYDTAYNGTEPSGVALGGVQDASVKRNSLIGTNGGVASGIAASYMNKYNPNLCSTSKVGTNVEWSYNINIGGLQGDCQFDPALLLGSYDWDGSISTTHNAVTDVSGLNLTYWQAFDNGAILANLAAVMFNSGYLTLQGGSPLTGTGIGADLSCFNETAIRNGTPSALCPLPPEVHTYAIGNSSGGGMTAGGGVH